MSRKISAEEKITAVKCYLDGKGSQDEICKKYEIRSKSKLQKWIKMYNGGEILRVTGTGGFAIMAKGPKTTFDGRIEIAQDCIAHE
ncbi:transposase [Anaerotruncus sp. 80]|uniref:Transposase n=1 Tax=Anaerotruncus colihominis TaxID=169435 RepID=A0A845QJP2_9FIRM|nr:MULTISPECIES: helix-turn-helix domain-containing protein [Clostridia]MCI9638632.1 transposase [Emergencia sp.]NBH60328.1 transposase [Anaerotruncus colihominis]NCF00071.1 transposase [Emergencia sp. 1XD21-10]NCF00982.1 transposase [Anaerotruncus sp. 80]